MRRNETVHMKDFSDKSIFELMTVSTEELKELSIEEFAEEIRGKRVDIHPFTENERSDVNGNIYICAVNVNFYIKEESDGYRVSIWGESTAYSQLFINLSERFKFGIYSYENGKNYRISFEGNSPDILITVVGWRVDKRVEEE